VDKNKRDIDRRRFLKISGAITGAAAIGLFDHRLSGILLPHDSSVCPVCVSQIGAQAIGGPRVVHIHAPSAVSWTGSDPQYWNYIDQSVVDEMVDRGLMNLTGTSSVMDAWQALIPNYQPGQGIAIKVNFNNSNRCDNTSGSPIDALIEPVNAVVRGLKQIGVVETDIWIYDAIRSIPDRFVNGCQYSGVQFFDKGFPGGCGIQGGFSSADPDSYVTFHPPQGTPMPSPVKITDVLINATYVINMPIMKYHGDGVGVTLGFKNHFGSIDLPENLHDYIVHSFQHYSPDYSPFVDLYKNPHIVSKTILTIGDGLIACKEGRHLAPSVWSTFGDQAPSSLFFASDPVAIDSVMHDFIEAERTVLNHSRDYLKLAGSDGLGVFESGNPWQEPYGSGYSSIEYIRLTHPFTTFVDVPLTHWAHDYIEAIYQTGYVAGCSADPPMYCPERILNRAESSVFTLRGDYGSIPDPPHTPPASPTFGDVDPAFWGYGWIESLWEDGYTAGCNTDPLLY